MIAASGFYVLFLAGPVVEGHRRPGRVGRAAAGPLPGRAARLPAAPHPDVPRSGAGSARRRLSQRAGVDRDRLGRRRRQGWLNGTQTHLDFLPERHTDFIFAVFGEEFGLIGNVVLIVLYLLLIGRGMVIAANASTMFARLIAGAVTLMFFTYAFVNMGMVSGVLPVVGVPLPFVSYGGTALLSLFIGLGILMSVQAHRKRIHS